MKTKWMKLIAIACLVGIGLGSFSEETKAEVTPLPSIIPGRAYLDPMTQQFFTICPELQNSNTRCYIQRPIR